MTHDEALLLVGRLAEAFPRNQLSEGTVRIYAEHLEDFDPGPAAMAVRKLEAEATFFPSIAELRRAINAITNPEPLTLDADSAWGEVLAEVRRVGWQGAPQLSPLVAETVRNLVQDWQAVCAGNPDFLRPNFLRLYETCLKRQQRERELFALPADVRAALTPPPAPPRAALEAPRPRAAMTSELTGATEEFSEALAQVGREVKEPSESAEVVEGRRRVSIAVLERIAAERLREEVAADESA